MTYTKPTTDYINQLRYMRHKHKLATIQCDRPQPLPFDPLSSAHKLRHHSIAFHQHQHQDYLNHENQKLLGKLLEISKRKKSLYGLNKPAPKMITFQNPARKKRQKMITQSNAKMAERLLAKQSFTGHKRMRKSIEQYEQLKRSMSNNRRVLYPSTVGKPSLPSIERKRDAMSDSSVNKKKATISFSQNPSFNPEYIEQVDQVVE